MPTFDLEAARKAGYSDDDIVDGLAKQQGVDVEAARKSGYSSADMLPSLMAGRVTAQKPGLLEDIETGIKATAEKVGAAGITAINWLHDHGIDPDSGSPLRPANYDPAKDREEGAELAAALQRDAINNPPQRWTGQVASGLSYMPFTGAAPLVVGSAEGLARRQQLIDQGVDPDTASHGGMIEGGIQAGIQMLPFGKYAFGEGGKQLARSVVGSSVKAGAAGAAQSVGSDVATQALLNNAGYEGLADKYNPTLEKAIDSAIFNAAFHGGSQAAHRIVNGNPVHNEIASAIDGVSIEKPGQFGPDWTPDAQAVARLNPNRGDQSLISPAETVKPQQAMADLDAAKDVDAAIEAADRVAGTNNDATSVAATLSSIRPLLEAKSDIEPTNPSEGASTDVGRRQDVEGRKSVDAMSPDEMRQALLTDDLTGLGNKRAYTEVEKKPYQASIDIDSLKWFNDNLGHEAGDQLIAAVGKALREETPDAFHLSGDEFAAHFDSEQAGHDAMARVRDRLNNAVFRYEAPDGSVITKNGAEVSYGIAHNLEAADHLLRADKASREANGARAARGAEPSGVVKEPATGRENDGNSAGLEQPLYSGIVNLNAGLNPGDAIKQAVKLSKAAYANYDGPGKALVESTKGWVSDVADDALMKASPMSIGTDKARAVAKDYANAERLARWQWGQFDNVIKRSYTPEQREAMWNAADQENLIRSTGKSSAGTGHGLDSLPPDQRATMDQLHQYGESLMQRARDVGMFQGEGVPYWAPRMAVMVGADGEYSRPASGDAAFGNAQGRNITTTASSLKQRKYLTSEETEAAMKGKLGEGAQIVRDIRTMPMAMARLERAIAGRELIAQIKDLGKKTGTETVSTSDGPGYFTLDHPAFKTYRPRMVEVDGKQVAAKDQNGHVILDKSPLYVSRDFEGPLRAIMSNESGKAYQALMSLKAKTMGVIMYSPLIHNAVEWGRALPMMPGKVLTLAVYFEGNKIKNDPVQMRQAISDGMVPIGHRGGVQDITGLMEDPSLSVGRSLTAKLIGGALDHTLGEKAGNAARKGVDIAGDFWHNTLLWDRIGDLQAGLYGNVKSDLIKKGMDAQTAGRLAAHFANRYAGALPNEAMSVNSRKIANFVLFSRSFTLGNLGVMKDMITGLPKDVQSQIKLDVGEIGLQAAKDVAKRKAMMAFALDIALLYAGNSILQDTLDHMKRDKSLSDIEQGYVDRMHKLMQKTSENPMSMLNVFGSIGSLTSNSENEPGKEDRIRFDTDSKGTATYLRLPTGKIGEEFKGWITSPLDTIKRKEGTIMRPIMQTIQNDKGFGRQVYNPDAEGIGGAAKNIGRIVWNMMSQQLPTDSIVSAHDWATGHADETDKLKAVGPLVGLTFSKGAPGGPAVGEMYASSRRHMDEVATIMPNVHRALKLGDEDAARVMMEAINMTQNEIRAVIRKDDNPESRLSRTAMRKFNQHATDEEKARMDQLRQ